MDRRSFISLAVGALAVPVVAPPILSSPRILVLGDSVMWGQGLEENEKIHRVLARLLFSQNGFEPSVLHYAHSGATIGYIGGAVAHAIPAPGWWPAEIPIASPTLHDQCNQVAADHPDERFDIVLLTGGINDVKVQNIFNPGTTIQQINDLSAKYCNGAMTSFLGELRSRYLAANPNIKILVLGYYSVLSSDSDVPDIFDVAKALAKEAINPPKPQIGAKLTTANAKAFNLQEKLIENSLAFRSASQANLANAVQNANLGLATPNFFFVDPMILDTEAAFTPNALIWGLRKSDETPEDPLYNDRLAYCANLLQEKPGIDRFTCDRASLGHPNVAGARRYAQKIFTFLSSTNLAPTPALSLSGEL